MYLIPRIRAGLRQGATGLRRLFPWPDRIRAANRQAPFLALFLAAGGLRPLLRPGTRPASTRTEEGRRFPAPAPLSRRHGTAPSVRGCLAQDRAVQSPPGPAQPAASEPVGAFHRGGSVPPTPRQATRHALLLPPLRRAGGRIDEPLPVVRYAGQLLPRGDVVSAGVPRV